MRPLGYVVALHGIQSHSGWYEYSSGRLAEAGYDVRFVDRRGSGLNNGDRGHIAHVDRLVNDVIQFLASVRHERNQQAAAAPVVLMAVSWGGKPAVAAAARRPELIDALALLYPGIHALVRPSGLQRTALRLFHTLGRGRRQVAIPLDNPAYFTGEPRWQQFIRDDEFALRTASVSFLKISSELDELLQHAPARIRCPVLLMLAGKDQIIDNTATRLYFETFASTERTLIEYPEAQHTLEFEPHRHRFVDDLLNWLGAVRDLC